MGSELPTARAVGELQEYGDNYYRWLQQGQELEPGVDGGSDGTTSDGDTITSGSASGDSAGGSNNLVRVNADDGVDDESCPDIGFVFDPDGQVPLPSLFLFPLLLSLTS